MTDNLLCPRLSPKAIADMAMNGRGREYESAKKMMNMPEFSCNRREIKTVASYYYHTSNGGLERNRCRLAELWEKMGYNVIMLTEDEPTPNDYYLPPTIKRVIIPNRIQTKYESYEERAASFQQAIIENHIDLIVYHAWLLKFMLWDEIAIKSTGCIFIASTHGVFSLPMLQTWDSALRFVAPSLLADAVVSQTDVSSIFWMNFNNNVHTVFNRLPEKAEEWNISSCENHEIVWIGRISEEKNPFDLLDIMECVIKVVPDTRLHIVGSTDNKNYYERFVNSVQERNLDDVIIMEGFQKDVRPYYESSTLLVITSESESYCNVLQEGLLAGLPIVMYSLPYLTLVKDNPGIVSVEMNNKEAMAAAIVDLLGCDDKRKQLGKASRAFINTFKDYDYEGKWRKIFDSAIYNQNKHLPDDRQLMLYTLINDHDLGIKKLKAEIEHNQSIIKKREEEIKKQREALKSLKMELHKYDRKAVRMGMIICNAIDTYRDQGLKELLIKVYKKTFRK